MKFVRYMLDTQGELEIPAIPAIPAPVAGFASVEAALGRAEPDVRRYPAQLKPVKLPAMSKERFIERQRDVLWRRQSKLWIGIDT